MYKRLQVVVRNMGLEGTVEALWTLSLEFRDEAQLKRAKRKLAAGLTNPLEQSVIIENESGDVLGFNPHHYAYHYISNAEGQPDNWWKRLPPDGSSAPSREGG